MTDQKKPTVKLDNSKSRFAKEQEVKTEFDEKVKQAMSAADTKKTQAAELAQQFMELLKSNTLPVNKGPMEKSLEAEVCKKLLDFAVLLNNDKAEPEGIGSTALNALLLKAIFTLRDQVNTLRHETEQLRTELKKKAV